MLIAPSCDRIRHDRSKLCLRMILTRPDLRTFPVILSFALALITPLAHAAEQTLDARRAELNRLLAEEWEYTLRTQPELATQIGDDRYNDRLSDFSDKALADDLEHTRQALARFEAID